MHAWLIVNGFLQTAKFNEIYSWLMEAAKKHNIKITMYKNTDFVTMEPLKHTMSPDFVIFWDKDVRLARQLETHGLRLFNCSDAIAASDDKSLTYLELAAAGIATPRTIIAPMTFSGIGYTELDFIDSIEQELGYPFIIKEAFGSFGAQVYLSHSRSETIDILSRTDCRPVIFQEFISSSTGRDIRINIVGDKPVASMLRTNPHDFRANITNGGSMTAYTPTDEQIQLAVKACKCLKLDFAGVDILFGENEVPLICELNSNAHFKNIYDCTGINVADAIIEHILQQGIC